MARQQVVHKNGVRRESVSISVLFLVEMRAKNGARSADEAINTVHAGNCHELILSKAEEIRKKGSGVCLKSAPKVKRNSSWLRMQTCWNC
jgi:hypothetical protein